MFDVHGVLLGRAEPPGHRPAGAVLAGLRRRGHRIRFVTNTSSVSRAALAGALTDAGVAAAPSEVFTAATTVGTYLRTGPVPRRLFVIGSDELRGEITRVGGDAVRWCGPAEADIVVVSRDPSLDGATLDLLRGNRNVRLVATCRDARFPTGGRLEQGPGHTVARVERALGKVAHVLGKPNHYVLSEVMGLTPRDLAETLVIGDSVDQDVMLARNAGARWLLLAGPATLAGQDTTGGPGTTAEPPADDALAGDALAGDARGRLINALDEMLELI